LYKLERKIFYKIIKIHLIYMFYAFGIKCIRGKQALPRGGVKRTFSEVFIQSISGEVWSVPLHMYLLTFQEIEEYLL